MKTRIVPLGTNGFFPSFGRQTMCFLVLTDTEAILLDAGTGVSRLLDPRIANLLSRYNCLNVFLSHYHLDHVVGLSYLPGISTCRSIKLYVPDKPFVKTTPRAALNRLLGPPLFALPLKNFPVPIELVPLNSENTSVGSLSIKLRGQKHPGGSVGIRIEDTIAYITDTAVDEQTSLFARNVKVLLHEVWLTDAESNVRLAQVSGHSYASGVAQIAKEAKADQLWMIHHHPKRSNLKVLALARQITRESTIRTTVPTEGKIYQVK